ncbi:MAG TPA: response regulator FixJ [Stellaceae bacterium]|nr:response regulator FixJ [Stellaceae bacterium]
MTENPKIFIVDDDEAVRDSLQLLLRSAGYTNVVPYASGREFLERAHPRPGDCLLLDVRMPDMDGLELQEELNDRGVRIPIIIMTGHGEVPIAVRAMKAGALDFVEKPFSDALLMDCVSQALAVAARDNRQAEESEGIKRRLASLTPRECEVLERMIAGQPNKLIAYDLGISPRTIEIHRARVMDKMQARSLSALVRMALMAGITIK